MENHKLSKLFFWVAILMLFSSPKLYAQKDYCNNPDNVVMTMNGTTATITWDNNGSVYYYWCISTSPTFAPGGWPDPSTVPGNGGLATGYTSGATTAICTGITTSGTLYPYVAGLDASWAWCTPDPGTTGAPSNPNSTPTLSTNPISTYSHNSAVLGGNISNDGGAAITGRGIVYSTTDLTPTIVEGASSNSNGTGTGYFSETTTGLSMETTYHVAAYATNTEGISYGSTVSFTTHTIPTVSTTSVTNITASTASSGGNISSNGGLSVTSRGVCWNTTGSPTTANSTTSNGTGVGSFSSGLTSLSEGTTYYVRAYAVNSAGTAYGNQISFQTNTRPTANNDSYTRFYTNNGTIFSVPVNGILANDTDPETVNTSLTVGTPRPASNVTHGSLSLSSTGAFTYTSTNGFKDASDSFTYYVNDGTDNSSTTATVTLNIVTPRFTGAGTNDNFSNPDNWNTGYVPNESLNLIIGSGQHIDFDMDYTCKDLKFESGSSFGCVSGKVLTINGNVLNRNNQVAIEVFSPIQISTSISINNE